MRWYKQILYTKPYSKKKKRKAFKLLNKALNYLKKGVQSGLISHVYSPTKHKFSIHCVQWILVDRQISSNLFLCCHSSNNCLLCSIFRILTGHLVVYRRFEQMGTANCVHFVFVFHHFERCRSGSSNVRPIEPSLHENNARTSERIHGRQFEIELHGRIRRRLFGATVW